MKLNKEDFDSKINHLISPFITITNSEPRKNLLKIKSLMNDLGSPEKSYQQIHLAGTSGKSSTAYYLSKLLSLNAEVGLSVSPHVQSITERCQLNARPISKEEFLLNLEKYKKLVQDLKYSLSYFELIYTFSLWYFALKKVDYAVIETGIGGRLDPTNVLDAKNKICLITDIGLDHMNLLGNSIQAIAYQKVGIVHQDNVLFMYEQSPDIMQVIQSWCNKMQANLYTLPADLLLNIDEIDLTKDFHSRNFKLALQVYEYIAKKDQLKNLDKSKILSSYKINIPGRMQKIKIKDKNLILDGAHNSQKIAAFINSYNIQYSQKPSILLAINAKKDYKDTLAQLSLIADDIILTSFENETNFPIESIDPIVLKRCLDGLNFKNYQLVENQSLALAKLLESKNKNLVVIGSFYIVSQVLRKLIKN